MIKIHLKIKAVLFDLDGTLTRYNLDYHLVKIKIVEDLNNHNQGKFKLEPSLTINAMFRSLKSNMPQEEFTKLLGRMNKVMEACELESVKRTELLPNTRITLENLKDEGLRMAIVTNNGRAAAKKAILRFHLSSLIDFLITREDVLFWKPDGAMVKEALCRLKVTSNEAVFVGDSTVDVLAARNSNVLSIAIPSGPTKRGDLLDTAPDYMLNSISDLSSLLNWLRIDTNRKDKKIGN